VKVLVEQLKSGGAANADDIDLIADLGGADDAAALFELAWQKHGNTPVATLLDALLRMSARKVAPNSTENLANLFEAQDPATGGAAMRLAGAWRMTSLRAQLIQAAEGEKIDPVVRGGAIDGLARMHDSESTAVLRRLANPTPPQVRHMALAGLAAVDLRSAAKSASQMLTSGDEDPAGVLSALLSRDGAAAALATSLKSAQIPRDTAKLSLRYLQGSTTQDPKLMQIFSDAAGTNTGPIKLTPDQMQQTVAEVLAKGDAARGEKVFRRADTNCYQCHAIAGTGGWLAPDLSGIGASAQIDYLINSILDPNKDIKDGFDGYAVATKSGDVYSGIKVMQDSAHLVLRDNDHQQISIPLSEVRVQKSIGSLMPNGLADPLTHQEFLDLIRFLSALGKPGAYGPSTSQYVRRWTTGAGRSAYSLFSGELPPEAIPADGKLSAMIDVSAAGKIGLQLGDPSGIEISIDGAAFSAANAKQEVELTHGQHTIALKVDASRARESGIRLEIVDLPGSNAHATAVGGK